MNSTEISKILANAKEKGNFLAAILTDHEGFPIASASNEKQSPEIHAALVGIIQRVTSQATEQLGLSSAAEFSLFDANGHLFICRPFSSKSVEMVLAFLLPNKDQSYRRIMSQTISEIQGVFDL